MINSLFADPDRADSSESLKDRLPASKEAEMALLGTILTNKDESISLISDVVELLPDANFFYYKQNKIIYESILFLVNAKHNFVVDIFSVAEQIRHKSDKFSDFISAYLKQLCNYAAPQNQTRRLAEIIVEKALLRELIELASDIASICMSGGDSIDKIFDITDEKIHTLSYRCKQLSGPRSISRLLKNYNFNLREKNNLDSTFLTTQFMKLNEMINGFPKGEVTVIASYSGIGKTSLALSFASFIAGKHRLPVAFFELAETSQNIIFRLISSKARVALSRLNGQILSDDDIQKIQEAMDTIKRLPIYIDDTPSQNMIRIRTLCRGIRAKYGLGVIIIDYLQLLEVPTRTKDQYDNLTEEIMRDHRDHEIDEIMSSVKQIARELDVPIILLAQLTRPAQAKINEKPLLSYIAGPGSIEEISDLVLLLNRGKVNNDKQTDTNVESVELIVAKQRNGPTGTISFLFNPTFVSFEST